MNVIWIAFLTGLTTGGLSCLAVQGGLLASSIASVQNEEEGGKWGYVAVFLAAKLFAYVVLGYLLGMLGSALVLTPKILGSVQILVGLFMLATAARLLDIHPIFRYFVIQPPRWAYRLLKNQSRNTSFFGPAVLGLLTVLMPCGVTQATMAVAVSSGSPFMGAAIMGAFVLGTSPIFFALGASIVQLLQRRVFSYVAAGVVAIFAILSINGGMGLRGSFYTLQNLSAIAMMDPSEIAQRGKHVAEVDNRGVQNVTIEVTDRGYRASATTLKKNVPVRLTLAANGAKGCARAFTIPDLNISKVLQENDREVIEFTPKREGRLAFACSMGMFTGSFNVIP